MILAQTVLAKVTPTITVGTYETNHGTEKAEASSSHGIYRSFIHTRSFLFAEG
jgi:hypothetical protein